ncbi:MAG TPA: amino acid adenylation domain-containing protein [Stenomitos sp.]
MHKSGRGVKMRVCVHEWFEEQVCQTPDAIAVEFGSEQLTYRALNQKANALACYLRTLNVGPETLVGVCLERSLNLIISLLGILKAGGAYLPLDPAYPKERIAYILQDAQVPLLLTTQAYLTSVPTDTMQVVCLDTDAERLTPTVTTENNLQRLAEAHNLAYVIYTSGSTGQPKGVMIEHCALMNFIESAQQAYGIVACDRVLQFSSISFDAAIEEIFITLTQGATLVLRTPEMLNSIGTFLGTCRDYQITVLDLPTAFWHKLCAGLEFAKIPESIRMVIIGGDRAHVSSLEQWNKFASPDIRLVNTYGPTESTVVATVCDIAGPYSVLDLVPNERNQIPIGKPLSNIQAYVLNSEQQPVGENIPGELYLSGLSLARGYLNKEALTNEKFIFKHTEDGQKIRLYKTADLVQYRSDGHLEFLERTDHQVKVRGFRVDLREIEDVLAQHPLVRESLVVAKEDEAGQKYLVAYVLQNYNKQVYSEFDLEPLDLEQMTQWQKIHNNEQLNPIHNTWDKTFNISGWINSYTGTLINEEEMKEWVDNTVARIQELQPKKILEIGCGTGLLLFRLAPQCEVYVGTDFSETALLYVQQQLDSSEINLPQVSLSQQRADELQDFEPQSFDVVVLNSVIQYFPGTDYLLKVIENALQVIKPGGFLFIGDIRNYLLLEAFAAAVELSNSTSETSVRTFLHNICNRLYREEELTLDPTFFLALKKKFPQISNVQVLLKRGQHLNELTCFRYDVVLQIEPDLVPDPQWLEIDWGQANLSIEKIYQFLEQEQCQALKVNSVPNQRVWKYFHALNTIKSQDPSESIGFLKEKFTLEDQSLGVDPEEFWQFSQTLPYEVTVSWETSDAEGSYQLLFQRNCDNSKASQSSFGSQNKSPLLQLRQYTTELDNEEWNKYANNPLKSKMDRDLSIKLRSYIKERLPMYMLPSSFVVLDDFPLTPSGKVDRRALPSPGFFRAKLSTEIVSPKTDLEKKLAQIWSRILEIDEVGIKDSFLELGGDSLRLIELGNQIESSYSIEFSLASFFENPTISGIVNQINQKSSLLSLKSTEFMTLEQLDSEAFLDESYKFDAPESQFCVTPKAILLTGATGFVGTFLLYELLQQTDAIIYCLVRADSKTQAYQRLRHSLERYFPDFRFPFSRVIPVIGDISQLLLGLPKREFDELSEIIDTIYHGAANVNLLHPYSALKSVNVLGTKSIIQFANHNRIKTVHYTSTLDVFESLISTGASTIYEDDSIVQGHGMAGGYAQSKWVAERLLIELANQGGPVCIYRPGMVAGDHRTGLCNTGDLLSRLLGSFTQLKIAPATDLMLDMTPVDYVAKAIVYLSLREKSLGKAFHLVNPNSRDLCQVIEDLNFIGNTIEIVDYEFWKNKVSTQENWLKPFKKHISEEVFGGKTRLEVWLSGQQTFDSQNTTSGLYGSEISCPLVDGNILKKYISCLAK